MQQPLLLKRLLEGGPVCEQKFKTMVLTFY